MNFIFQQSKHTRHIHVTFEVNQAENPVQNQAENLFLKSPHCDYNFQDDLFPKQNKNAGLRNTMCWQNVQETLLNRKRESSTSMGRVEHPVKKYVSVFDGESAGSWVASFEKVFHRRKFRATKSAAVVCSNLLHWERNWAVDEASISGFVN